MLLQAEDVSSLTTSWHSSSKETRVLFRSLYMCLWGGGPAEAASCLAPAPIPRVNLKVVYLCS